MFIFFSQVAQVDQELLQITATNVIFDLFLMYGLQAFNIDQNKNDETAEQEDGKQLELKRV